MGNQSGQGTQEYHSLQESKTDGHIFTWSHVPILEIQDLKHMCTLFLIRLFVCVCCFQSLEECESHGLPVTEQGRLDLELKIEDTKENIRKAEVCYSYCQYIFYLAKLLNRG